jgi:hypothetical protein
MTTNGTTTIPREAWKIVLGVIAALAGVSLIVFLLAILIHYAYVQPQVAGVLTPTEREALLAKTRADDQKTLTTYGWMDKSKGIVRLPIDVAMQKVIEERSAGK